MRSDAPPPETLAEFMRRMRDRQGLTQSKAAERLSVSERTYSNYEAGTDVPPERFAAIAKLFGVTEGVVAMLAADREGTQSASGLPDAQGFWEIAAIVDRVRGRDRREAGE